MDPGRGPYVQGYAQQQPGSVSGVPMMATPAQPYPGPVPQAGFRPETMYADKRGRERLSTSFSPDNVFTWTSILLLVTLMVIPVWNACALLTDENYVYWAGRAVPALMISACIGILTVYVVTMLLFFKWARPSVRSSEQTVMMIVNMFITLLGLTLMLISLPLSRQAADTYIALTHRCDYDDLTHRTFEYWAVLDNIRRQPECSAKASVEECAGYEVAAPYTTFLKTMETNFRCSGFCWKPPPVLADTSAAAKDDSKGADDKEGKDKEGADGKEGGSAGDDAAATPPPTPAPAQQLVKIREHKQKVLHRRHRMLSFLQESASDAPASPFPQSLFSRTVAQASCEGMAGRDMRNFAGDIGYQTFYQGIYLVVIAIATGFLKLIGACLARDKADQSLAY